MSASGWGFQKGPCLPCSRLPLGTGPSCSLRPSDQKAGRQEELPHVLQSKLPQIAVGAWGIRSRDRCELQIPINKSPLGSDPGSQQLWMDQSKINATSVLSPGCPCTKGASHGPWLTQHPLQGKLPLRSGLNDMTGPVGRADWPNRSPDSTAASQ